MLLKLQLDTIKPIEIKLNARSKFYQENTNYIKKAHRQQIEELKNKVDEITPAIEKLVLIN